MGRFHGGLSVRAEICAAPHAGAVSTIAERMTGWTESLSVPPGLLGSPVAPPVLPEGGVRFVEGAWHGSALRGATNYGWMSFFSTMVVVLLGASTTLLCDGIAQR